MLTGLAQFKPQPPQDFNKCSDGFVALVSCIFQLNNQCGTPAGIFGATNDAPDKLLRSFIKTEGLVFKCQVKNCPDSIRKFTEIKFCSQLTNQFFLNYSIPELNSLINFR